jgi:hypothetical protein
MNVPCVSCGTNHQSLQTREIIQMLKEFQEGNGQIVTTQGIESRCILETIALPPRRNNATKRIASYGQATLSPVLR